MAQRRGVAAQPLEAARRRGSTLVPCPIFAEQRIAIVNELIPFLLLMPDGQGRTDFLERIATRVGVSVEALELAVGRRSAPAERPRSLKARARREGPSQKRAARDRGLDPTRF